MWAGHNACAWAARKAMGCLQTRVKHDDLHDQCADGIDTTECMHKALHLRDKHPYAASKSAIQRRGGSRAMVAGQPASLLLCAIQPARVWPTAIVWLRLRLACTTALPLALLTFIASQTATLSVRELSWLLVGRREKGTGEIVSKLHVTASDAIAGQWRNEA